MDSWGPFCAADHREIDKTIGLCGSALHPAVAIVAASWAQEQADRGARPMPGPIHRRPAIVDWAVEHGLCVSAGEGSVQVGVIHLALRRDGGPAPWLTCPEPPLVSIPEPWLWGLLLADPVSRRTPHLQPWVIVREGRKLTAYPRDMIARRQRIPPIETTAETEEEAREYCRSLLHRPRSSMLTSDEEPTSALVDRRCLRCEALIRVPEYVHFCDACELVRQRHGEPDDHGVGA